MKRTVLNSAIFVLLLHLEVFSQNNMPRYNIRCEREGAYFGDFKVELFSLVTPLHTRNFDSLVSINFYDSTAFHRVVPAFVIQGGDPNSRHGDPSTWGNGDPSQTNVPAEFTNIVHARGIIGAARDANINSANSQFYVNLVENNHLNGQYTAYGRVYDGMNIVDTIENTPLLSGTSMPQKKITMFVTKIGYSNAVPGIPGLVSPADNSTDVYSAVNFEWTSIAGAVLYRLQIAKDSLFNNPVYDKSVGRNSTIPPALEQGRVKHFWRVSANNGGNISNYSAVRSFTTGIASPGLIHPADSAAGLGTSLTFNWNRVDGASSYRFQLATTPGFFGVGLVQNQIITDTTTANTNLLPNKRYYWRVRGLAPAYEGPVSVTRTFVTGSASDAEELMSPAKISLEQNYPNPFNPSTMIRFTLPERTFAKIRIIDPLGNQVSLLAEGEFEPGTQEIEFNGNALSSGIYFYELITKESRLMKKLIYLK